MKKNLGMLLLALFSSNFVLAQYTSLGYNLATGMNTIIDAIIGLLGPLFYVLLGSGYEGFLFERTLFLLIVLSIVYVAVKQMTIFQGNTAIIGIVTITVSLLSTRFLTESALIKTIILPYSVLGVSLTAILPLLIFFFFVRSFQESAVIRKILWVFFIIVFIGLWGSRYEELRGISWIYFWTGVVAVLFFLFDGTIQRALVKARLEGADERYKMEAVRDIRRKIGKLDEDFSAGLIQEKQYETERRALNNQIKTILKS